ncbi:ABC transporter permease [Nocardia terpenica]|uniref:ABC transporter permease n=1 Tax=Nocardia terpenica TaxID=455432 RepID=UPI001893F2FB|nr:ABC transporter permease [Nocardia terpenica]MBF6059988.1 ABC transporter permease [Nocardia terpenica]MBF6102471.1 ABC transporter permease [Nocardia terpenica]MBF6111338.1 ABC transporter permease [Nocardia terpenica]MBF6117469.1 ABC transporter permease [Nocardia terpenica]MBF6150690.1 ABC transporter permease [Nocardia terpenica]
MNQAVDHAPQARAVVLAEIRRRRWLRRRDIALAVLTPVVALAIWQWAAQANAIDARVFPPPSRTLARAVDMIASGELPHDSAATLIRLLGGYLPAAVAGTMVGLAMGAWRSLGAALAPFFTALYALPKIAVLPLLLLIFGLGDTPRILAVAITVFFVTQINAQAAMRQLDPGALELARAYRVRGWRRLRLVVGPACLPQIFTGLRVAVGLGVVVAIAVEFVASDEGIGYLIWNSWQLFQPERMYVGLLAAALLGAGLTGIVSLCGWLAMPWRRQVPAKSMPGTV